MRAIVTRLNENPDLARLVFVNPVLVLQDLGVDLSSEAKQHVMDALRFPPRIREQTAALQQELRRELDELGIKARLPLSTAHRAHLLFNVLQLEPRAEDAGTVERLAPGRTADYADAHPLVAKLAEYERIRRGALLFQSRASYEAFKRGDADYPWIDRVTFDV